MARTMVVVHGMGVNTGAWATGVVDTLNTCMKRYKVFESMPPIFVLGTGPDDMTTTVSVDQVLVIPVGYDHVMRARVDSFQRDTKAITALAAAEQISLPRELTKVLGAFSTAGETENNFFWSHVVDVLLYHYFPLVTIPVRLAVMHGIAQVLARVDSTVSVMAHSLGTAVTHDALADLGGGVFPEFGALRPPGVRIANLYMVANVSRVLEKTLARDVDVYTSCVAPISVRGDDAYLQAYYNFRHMLDPFTVPKRFEPQWSGSDFHRIENLLNVGNFNVHGWEHYLDNPEVHIPIINSQFGFKVISDDVAHTAIESYKVAPVPLCTKGLEFWTARTRAIAKKLEENPTVPELLLAAAQYFATAKLAQAKCGQPSITAGLTVPGGGVA